VYLPRVPNYRVLENHKKINDLNQIKTITEKNDLIQIKNYFFKCDLNQNQIIDQIIY